MMSYKNVTCVCEKNEIHNNKEREKAFQKSSQTSSSTISLDQHSGSVMKEGLFCTLFLSFINGEAGLRLAILIRRVSEAG